MDLFGTGGGGVCDPPAPKKTHALIIANQVRQENVNVMSAKIHTNENVCVHGSIKFASVTTTSRTFPQLLTTMSRSRTFRGDRNGRLLVQNTPPLLAQPLTTMSRSRPVRGVESGRLLDQVAPITRPPLKGKDGIIVGVGNQRIMGNIPRQLELQSEWHQVAHSPDQRVLEYNRRVYSPGSPPPNYRRSAPERPADGLEAAAISKYSVMVPPHNKTTTTWTSAGTTGVPAGAHTSVTSSLRSKIAAARILHKYNTHVLVTPALRDATVTSCLPAPRGAVTSRPHPAPRLPRVSNPLGRHLQAWRTCNPCNWILRTITHGYRLQFARRPPLTREVIPTLATGQALVTLREEIQTLLDKGAIQKVNLEKSPGGFYSKYFLVTKKGGGMRPILDLRGLNKYLKTFRFKMLTTASLLRKVRRGAWFTSVDLKDAFFHVSIYPPHRKFLRFALDGEVYQYTVLPFGMSLSPRVFTKCTQAAIAPLRAQGIRLDTFLDDWLISADSLQEANRHTETVVSHLTSLGFNLNLEKSALVPSQQTTFIGVMLDSTTLMARLTQERIDRFLSCMMTFHDGTYVSYGTCMRVAGFMASAIHLIRLGRFYMRPFQK